MKGLKKYIDFLENTLIPDLKESGKNFTAKDFESMVKFLKGQKICRKQSKKQFVEFLKNTLVPDLNEAGQVYTAESFEEGIEFLENM